MYIQSYRSVLRVCVDYTCVRDRRDWTCVLYINAQWARRTRKNMADPNFIFSYSGSLSNFVAGSRRYLCTPTKAICRLYRCACECGPKEKKKPKLTRRFLNYYMLRSHWNRRALCHSHSKPRKLCNANTTGVDECFAIEFRAVYCLHKIGVLCRPTFVSIYVFVISAVCVLVNVEMHFRLTHAYTVFAAEAWRLEAICITRTGSIRW